MNYVNVSYVGSPDYTLLLLFSLFVRHNKQPPFMFPRIKLLSLWGEFLSFHNPLQFAYIYIYIRWCGSMSQSGTYKCICWRVNYVDLKMHGETIKAIRVHLLTTTENRMCRLPSKYYMYWGYNNIFSIEIRSAINLNISCGNKLNC
jgi:hypothetical protein